MVDLESSPPPSAAASHHKVSHRHCGQVGCCFSLLIVLCLLCLLRFIFLLFRHRHCLRSSPDLFFLLSLSFLLLVGCRLFLGSRPWAAPVLGSSPWRCSFLVPFLGLGGAPARFFPRPRRCSWPVPSSALVVLLLGPFLGLGGPRLFSLALVLLLGASPSPRCSARNLRSRLGSPSWLLGLACLGSPPWLQSSVP
jgi:hypothetical protein